MKRNIYLNAVEYNNLDSILEELLKRSNYDQQTKTINTKESLHYITSKSIYANVSSPSYNASAMDGIAIKSETTKNADESNPVTLKPTDFIYINTGNIVPLEFDAVVMIEDVHQNKDNSITLYQSSKLYENIRPIGEDITKGNLILPKHHQVRPIDIAALISAGINEIEVIKPINIAIIPTGDEIVDDSKDMTKGNIQDSNSYFVKNELNLLHVNATIFPIQKDIFERLEDTIVTASTQYDLLLIGAGSSAGNKDFVKAITEKNGTVLSHGINIKPGKPTVIGLVNKTPLIGLPGFPVSTYISFNKVVKPLICKMMSMEEIKPYKIQATLSQKVYSSLKNHEFIRVRLATVNNKLIAIPLSRKAGVTMSVVNADGILTIPKNSEGFKRGDIVEVELLSHKSHTKTIVINGSHDILFDYIQENLSNKGVTLLSTHTGSMGGVLSISNNECHIAPVHVLKNGTYNTHLINEFLTEDYILVNGVERIQGLYVKKGNPKNITQLSDIKNHRFVNRQLGSGTRILLDYLLHKENINLTTIKGYNFELTTHTLVAESIKDDRFDVGLGVKSVALTQNIDFIPLMNESYDFIIHKSFLKDPLYKLFTETLHSATFKKTLEKLGGYKLK